MLDDQAQNAVEAMQRLNQAAANGTPYDVAVLDMLMPGKDGLQLAQEIKSHPQGAGVRLIVLTSLIQPGHAERARRAGFNAYLTKPVRHDQLQGCLRVVFGLQQAAVATNVETGLSGVRHRRSSHDIPWLNSGLARAFWLRKIIW